MKKNIEIDKNKEYSLKDAVAFMPLVSKSKFVGSIDLDILLKLKEAQKKEIVRGTIDMPNTFGEEKKVIVFCDEGDEKKAVEAGAIKAGLDTLLNDVMDNKVEYDVVVATPSVMPKIAKLGKVLGPKGLMPNPRNGTVTNDIENTVKGFISGKVSFKSAADQGVIRLRVAKVDMDPVKIEENLIAALKSINIEAKKLNPSPFKQILMKPTMGPSIKIDINDIMQLI